MLGLGIKAEVVATAHTGGVELFEQGENGAVPRQLGVGIEGDPGCKHEHSFVRPGMRKYEFWRRRWVSDDDVDVQSA